MDLVWRQCSDLIFKGQNVLGYLNGGSMIQLISESDYTLTQHPNPEERFTQAIILGTIHDHVKFSIKIVENW